MSFRYTILYMSSQVFVCVYSLCINVCMCFEMPRDWEEVRVLVIRPGPIPTSSPCGNTIPADDQLTVSLPTGARCVKYPHTIKHRQTGHVYPFADSGSMLLCCRFVVLPHTVCLEKGVSYKLRVEFIRYADRNSILSSSDAFVLVDSVSSKSLHL